MQVLRAQGKIIYAGSSNFAGWHIAQAQEAARRHGAFGLVSEQSLYNLAARTVELEVLPACQGYGLGVLPWSPLHGGLLGGILRKRDRGRAQRRRPGRRGPGRAGGRQVEAYEAFCARARGADPAEVGLAWLLHQPAVTAPIVGPRTLGQLDGRAARAADHSWTSSVARPRWTRSSPAPAAPRPRPTRGEPPPRVRSSAPSRLRSRRRSESSRAASAPVWSCSATQASSAHSPVR